MDAMIFPAPLQEVGLQIAEELGKQGLADRCGGCGKPFNRARKWRTMKRLTVATLGHGMFTWSALLCGRCTAGLKRGDTAVLDRLNREALREAALLVAMPEGSA